VTAISAQVSLYPLRQPDLSSAIDDALEVFRAHSLVVVPGTMSTVITGDIDNVFGGLQEALLRAVEEGAVVMTVTLSNACPGPRGLPRGPDRGGRDADAAEPRPPGFRDDEQLEGN